MTRLPVLQRPSHYLNPLWIRELHVAVCNKNLLWLVFTTLAQKIYHLTKDVAKSLVLSKRRVL